VQDFKKLTVWQKSHSLTLLIYKATRSFPAEERFGLTSQIRRASYSIPANIAEGCGRGSRTDLRRFLHISMGSACEVEYFLSLARDLGIMTVPVQAQLDKNVVEVKRMLTGLIERLEAAPPAKN